MSPLAKMILWSAASAYLAIRSYVQFRNPSPDTPWFTPYFLGLLAGLLFFSAFGAYRNRNIPAEPDEQPEPPTGAEQFVFRVLGAFVILAGVAGTSIACWAAWGQWSRVAQWPRADAILIRKELSPTGARLIFDYEVEGRHFTGQAFRWGSESAVGAALEAYEPGTVQRISYDPHDPAQVETTLTYNWELFRGSATGIVIGLLLILGGVMVYRWSIPGRFSGRKGDGARMSGRS